MARFADKLDAHDTAAAPPHDGGKKELLGDNVEVKLFREISGRRGSDARAANADVDDRYIDRTLKFKGNELPAFQNLVARMFPKIGNGTGVYHVTPLSVMRRKSGFTPNKLDKMNGTRMVDLEGPGAGRCSDE